MTNNKYKPTVSAIILNKNKEVLLTHNKSHGPDFWKFPQGGVENDESLEEAIRREMNEELGLNDLLILKESSVEYKYLWPAHVQEIKGYMGPQITFFYIQIDDDNKLIPDQNEIDGTKWTKAEDLPAKFKSLPEFSDTVNKLVEEIKLL